MLVSNGKVDFKKLAYRYRVIQDMYSGNINIPALITQRLHGEIESLVNEIDKYTDGWIMEGKRALQWSSSKYVFFPPKKLSMRFFRRNRKKYFQPKNSNFVVYNWCFYFIFLFFSYFNFLFLFVILF